MTKMLKLTALAALAAAATVPAHAQTTTNLLQEISVNFEAFAQGPTIDEVKAKIFDAKALKQTAHSWQ